MVSPKFSIIIPVYNAENTVNRTINYLKDLSYTNYEVILIDDGSGDSTGERIRQLINADNRFKLYRKENEGPGSARNFGIEKACGDYLLFFDVDDYAKSTILLDYSEIIGKYPDMDLIISSFTFRSKDKDRVLSEKDYLVPDCEYLSNSTFLSDLYDLMNKQLMYVVWNKCYKREIIMKEKIRFKDYRSCEDRIFNLEYYQFCNKVSLNPKVEYVYEFDGASGITNRYFSDKFTSFKEFYEVANDITDDQLKPELASLFLKGVVSVIFSVLNTDKLTSYNKKNEINSILADSSVIEAKKIAKTDTSSKKMVKLMFNSPKILFACFIKMGSIADAKLPRLITYLKRIY
ncbi:glycosyltransferase family 2 protein [Enterococcus sp. 669A]|uniref:Glycosyltransferase family 2 protein n=1 Tax=Candidatus Enterococcus moelleringii TaxID=2815325 RepID=A0ABS3LF12_9ENTE|nr:glycosyltransferase family 2 protein [Enterococcus sp. 669A]MBO1308229.1 glycosyltransferase family 2 protein [Enterococcus sp. 669A]